MFAQTLLPLIAAFTVFHNLFAKLHSHHRIGGPVVCPDESANPCVDCSAPNDEGYLSHPRVIDLLDLLCRFFH